MSHRNYQQGTYTLKNPEKYLGAKPPTYRSSFELRVFDFFDRAPAVIKWGAETVVVKYHDPIKNQVRRYLVDVVVTFDNRDGQRITELIEIKPYEQTVEPKRGRKSKNSYDEKMMTYVTNRAKWEAAEQFARSKGWQWRLLTEKEIFA